MGTMFAASSSREFFDSSGNEIQGNILTPDSSESPLFGYPLISSTPDTGTDWVSMALPYSGTYYVEVWVEQNSPPSGDSGSLPLPYRLDVSASPGATWPPAKPEPNPCEKAFPGAHTAHIGRTAIHNYQSSVQMVSCDQFGVDTGKVHIQVTPDVVCGLIASATGWGSGKAAAIWRVPRLAGLGPATDGACSAGEVTGPDSTGEKAASVTCSWAADLLGAKTPSPGFLAGLGCDLAPVIGNTLGMWWETKHEHDVALAVIRRGDCIKYFAPPFPESLARGRM